MSAQNGHLNCLRLLHDAGYDLGQAIDDGSTPAFIAAAHGHVNCLRLLQDAGCDLEQARNDGCTPAFIATERGHTDCVRLLKEVEEANMVRKQNEADRAMRELLAELAGEKVGNTSSPKKKKKKKKQVKRNPDLNIRRTRVMFGLFRFIRTTTSDLDTTEKGIICLICWDHLKGLICKKALLSVHYVE